MLQLQRYRHGREQHRPDEDVVDAERLLDQVSAQILAERLPTPAESDEQSEAEATGDPDRGLQGRLPGGGCVGLAMAVEVEREQSQDDGAQSQPVDRVYVDIDEVVPRRGGDDHRVEA